MDFLYFKSPAQSKYQMPIYAYSNMYLKISFLAYRQSMFGSDGYETCTHVNIIYQDDKMKEIEGYQIFEI